METENTTVVMRNENDHEKQMIDQFCAQALMAAPGESVPVVDIAPLWAYWCEENGHKGQGRPQYLEDLLLRHLRAQARRPRGVHRLGQRTCHLVGYRLPETVRGPV